MSKDSNSLSKFDKKWAKHLAKENQKFEDHLNGLYDDLYKRYEIEFPSIRDQEEKVRFLSELLDEIIEAKHDAEHNFTISPIVAKSIKKLNGLFKKFEYEIQDLTVFGKESQNLEYNHSNRKMEVLLSKVDDKLISLDEKTESIKTPKKSPISNNIEEETPFKV